MAFRWVRWASTTSAMLMIMTPPSWILSLTSYRSLGMQQMGHEDNSTKCKIMTADNRDITINGSPVDKVDDFVFLGSNVPSVEADVKRRTRLAAWAFGRLKRSVWTNQDISRSLKVRIYKALILPIAIYEAESWTLRQADARQLESFEMRCLRVILGVHLMDRVKNEEIRQRLNIPNTICEEVSKRRMKWFGHVVRMPHHRLPL